MFISWKEVFVQVEAVGICAGDAKTFTGAERFWGEPRLPAPFPNK